MPLDETEDQAAQRVKLFATEGAYCAEDLLLNNVVLHNDKAIPLTSRGRVHVAINHEPSPQLVNFCERLDGACRSAIDSLKQDLLDMSSMSIDEEPANIPPRTAAAAQTCLRNIFASSRAENDLGSDRDAGSASSVRKHAGPLSPKRLVKSDRSASSRLGAKLRSRDSYIRNNTTRPRQLSRKWVEAQLSSIAWDGLDVLLRANLTNWPMKENTERAWELGFFQPLGYAALYYTSQYLSQTDPSLKSLKCRPDGVWKCLCLLRMMEDRRPIPNARECKLHTRPDTMMELKLPISEADICVFSSEGKNKDYGESYKLRDVYKAAFLALASLVLMQFSAGESSEARGRMFVPFVTFSGTLVEMFAVAPYEESYALYSVRKWRLGSAEEVCDPKEIVEVWAAMWFTAYYGATRRYLAKSMVTDVRRTVLGKISRNWKDYPTKKTSRKGPASRNPKSRSGTNNGRSDYSGANDGKRVTSASTAQANTFEMDAVDTMERSSFGTSTSDDTVSALDFILGEIRTHGIGKYIVQVEERLSPRETNFYSKTQGRYMSSWELRSSFSERSFDEERRRCWVYRAQLKPRNSSSTWITGVVKLLSGVREKRVEKELEVLSYCYSKDTCSRARVPLIVDAARLAESSWVLCMEYKGAALLTGPAKAVKLLSWASQILEALAYLHYDLRIVHGDIKPGNVCEDDNGLLWFIDFELAMRLQEGQEDGFDCLGYTRDFAAPEVIDLGLLTRKADVYSTGMTLKHWMHSLDEEKLWDSADDMIVRRSLSNLVSKMTDPKHESRVTSVEALKYWTSLAGSKLVS